MLVNILMGIKNMGYRIVDLLMGHTPFFLVILGWFLVISGILLFLQPEKARQKLLRMGFKQVKGLLFIAVVFILLTVFSWGAKLHGILALALMVFAFILAIRWYLLLKKSSFDRMAVWFQRIPIPTLKAFASIQIGLGVLLLVLKRRFW
jgi:hypothetical protein